MKAFLMYPERNFDLDQPLPVQAEALRQDLELEVLLGAMAEGDEFLYRVAERGLFLSLTSPELIIYRQEILKDCLQYPQVVRQIYSLAVEAIEEERKQFRFSFRSPEPILRRSVTVMRIFVGLLRRLRKIADENSGAFHSEGFTNLFALLRHELSDEYLAEIERHLVNLRFENGVFLSAGLGKGNKGGDYVLCEPVRKRRSWNERLWGKSRSTYSFVLPERDESGWRALAELEAKGINLVANALAQSCDHVLSFFTLLRAEVGFYVACLNLYERLRTQGEPVCFPVPERADTPVLSFQGLYDPCLSLKLGQRVVGNDLDANGKLLLVITGASQGGKTTFLRSLGLAQLMMQAGMFVAAESFRANVCSSLYTHFKREEDTTMTSGKLDEELRRMSEIAQLVRPSALLLSNESFAATNEREGSQIAEGVIRAFVETGVKVAMVTHLFELARNLCEGDGGESLFLRAERTSDGRRTFRIQPGEPLPTSHGKDLYERIFGF